MNWFIYIQTTTISNGSLTLLYKVCAKTGTKAVVAITKATVTVGTKATVTVGTKATVIIVAKAIPRLHTVHGG